VAKAIVDKSKQRELTALELLALSELVNKQELNLHA
jgi:hypothetical protein